MYDEIAEWEASIKVEVAMRRGTADDVSRSSSG